MDLLEELANGFRINFGINPNAQTYEILLGGYASAGDEGKVSQLCTEMHQTRQKVVTARGYSLTIKGFLKNGLVDAALRQIQDMHQRGLFVPSFAIAQLFRTACQQSRGVEVFEAVLASKFLQLPQDAVAVLLEDCAKRNDMELAMRVQKLVRESKNQLSTSAYDSLLKICVGHADVHALELFAKMQEEGIRISEGLCVGLLARCADSKFLRFAEEIVAHVRSQNAMSIACYSALMKVYAYCGMYDKACDLYSQIKQEGLEPDSMMYGCLMKFSVECGRTDLSQELFDKSPSLDIQNYMSLIRAAGRDKDVHRAFAVLDKLKASGVSVDIAAYNCVLDACVSAGDLKRARALMTEMQELYNKKLDIITYNTLLKGYCSKGDVRGAKDLFLEMERAGLSPNDVSHNCLINAAVCSGNFREAWNTIALMEQNGVPVDHYTLSIMMKALKKVKDPRDVARALDLLDRSGVNVNSDEVLLNTVLETCTRHRQLHRLESIISTVMSSNLRPSVHTYGSLIKGCSTIKRLELCQHFWHMMVDKCAMQPNEIVLGCMLDALVCNDKVEEAVTLLNTWRSTLTPNTVMYSTIIKGFANSRQAQRALDMWKEMREQKLSFNTVVYNSLIDSQARVGAMDEVSQIVESMEPNGCRPDSITYSTIVKGYCIKGDLDKAFDVFRNMQSNGLAVDSIVYNTIMDGATRHNRMDLVDQVLEDMQTHNIKPSNFTLGILMKMYGRRHQLDKAFQVLEDLPKRYGLQVNSQVRTCLMCACLSNHDLDRALQVFEEIKEAGPSVDMKAYTSLLAGFVRIGKLNEAVALVKEAYGLNKGPRRLTAGQNIEAETMEQLVRALGQNQLMQSIGVPLLEQLRAAKVPVSGRLFSSALNGRLK
jgi:pentatricopeptide repeat protein